jgi:hypothetical protein
MAKVGTITAILCFIIGTYLFMEFMVTGRGIYAIMGLYYVLGATIVNLMVILLVVKYSQGKAQRNTILIMLSNIPVALVYLYFAMGLIQKMDV